MIFQRTVAWLLLHSVPVSLGFIALPWLLKETGQDPTLCSKVASYVICLMPTIFLNCFIRCSSSADLPPLLSCGCSSGICGHYIHRTGSFLVLALRCSASKCSECPWHGAPSLEGVACLHLTPRISVTEYFVTMGTTAVQADQPHPAVTTRCFASSHSLVRCSGGTRANNALRNEKIWICRCTVCLFVQRRHQHRPNLDIRGCRGPWT